MTDIEHDPLSADRALYDETDYADLDLQPAEDVEVIDRPAPRSTFALRLDGATIDQLRSHAARLGTRPTQLARKWLIERLEREDAGSTQAADGRHLEARVAALEDRIGPPVSQVDVGSDPSSESVVAALEAPARFARLLLQRLGDDVAMEMPHDADLIVRRGGKAWVIEFKRTGTDLGSSLAHVISVARQQNARPVLVSTGTGQADASANAEAWDVVLADLSDLDEVLDEIAIAGDHTG